MQLKYKSYVHLVVIRKFIVLSAVVVLAVSLSRRQNGDGSEEKRLYRSLVRKQKRSRERKCSHNAVKSALRMMSTRESSSA